MFTAVSAAELLELPEVRRSMLVDRAQQFVDRHKWKLTVDSEGLEVDAYDTAGTTYCIVESEDRHLASVRLRPASTGSMVKDHFPRLWQGSEERLGTSVEITRFCSAPGLTPDQRIAVVSDLLLGLCRYCQNTSVDRFFGVVFPSVARVLRQAGWPGSVLKADEHASGTLLLCEWMPSELVAWDIQEKRELREEAWLRRNSVAPKPAMELAA